MIIGKVDKYSHYYCIPAEGTGGFIYGYEEQGMNESLFGCHVEKESAELYSKALAASGRFLKCLK